MKSKKEEESYGGLIFIAIILTLVGIYFIHNWYKTWDSTCSGPVDDDPNVIWHRQYTSSFYDNYSHGSLQGQLLGLTESSYNCIIRNLTQERLVAQETARQRAIAIENQNKLNACYSSGRYDNRTYDLQKDYNLSCSKIQYINDHLLLESNERRESGSISGYYSGFLSSGEVSGEFYQWIYSQVTATGNLPKFTSVHYDCNNSTKDTRVRMWLTTCKGNSCETVNDSPETRKIEYYTTKDFINYYVTRCMK